MRSLDYNTAIATCRTQQHDPNLGYARCLMPNCVEEATDPHHWLFPQANNVPLEVQDDPRNIGLLCKAHHDACHHGGKREETTLACYRFKAMLYDLQNWLDSLVGQRLIKIRPSLPQFTLLSDIWQMYIFLRDMVAVLPNETEIVNANIIGAVHALEFVLNITPANECEPFYTARKLNRNLDLNVYEPAL